MKKRKFYNSDKLWKIEGSKENVQQQKKKLKRLQDNRLNIKTLTNFPTSPNTPPQSPFVPSEPELEDRIKLERNKQVVRTVVEKVFNERDYSKIPECYSKDCAFPGMILKRENSSSSGHDDLEGHANPPTVADTSEGSAHQIIENTCRLYSTAFPDLRYNIVYILAEGDLVSVHWTVTGHHLGPLIVSDKIVIKATGQSFNVTSTAVVKVKDGKVVEVRQDNDLFSLYKQLGALKYFIEDDSSNSTCNQNFSNAQVSTGFKPVRTGIFPFSNKVYKTNNYNQR